MKMCSSFFPPERLSVIRNNMAQDDWARDLSRTLVEQAQYWRNLSLEEIWSLMFGPSITRSWFVRSDGHCPSCGRRVPMYTWLIDAQKHPWKVQCPHCGEMFPKNDFPAYYRSGLNRQGWFDYGLADPSLLYNADHPDPGDPLHRFGVDDGYGYAEGETRWWFIGAYLVYGQWKQLMLGGMKSLAAATVLTGDREYARRAAVLLDRAADIFPRFSFLTQGIMYDVVPYVDGFVSYSVDHCMEMKDVVEAYDAVFDMVKDDAELVAFLSEKARQTELANRKECFGDIRANIEENLLITGISDPLKLDCNFPWEHIVKYMVKTVVGRPEDEPERQELLRTILFRSTAVDGTSGEKGLANYSSIATKTLSMFLAAEAQRDGAFLARALAQCPDIRDMYRFFIDLIYDGVYLPTVGDSGYAGYPALSRPCDFAHANKGFYPTVYLAGGLEPSSYSLLGELYRLTGDADFLRVAWHSNGRSVAGLPYDINCPDAPAFQRLVSDVIARQGEQYTLKSVNKERWHLAALRQSDADALAVLTYDMRGADLHGHCDGLSLGLFAFGRNMMPDFGYPPVQYGGWFTDQSKWYAKPTAHNTVVVDGRDQVRNSDGRTTLWAAGERIQAIALDGRRLVDREQYDRTTALISAGEGLCYLFDLFRVTGGRDHAFFLHGSFGTLRAAGIAMHPAAEYGNGSLLRNFTGGPVEGPGWLCDWTLEDCYSLEGEPRDVHLRYTGLTDAVAAYVCEAWVNAGDYNTNDEAWIPTLMARRQSEAASLQTAFVGILEPYEGESAIDSMERIPLLVDGCAAGETDVAVSVCLATGRRDWIVSLDTADDCVPGKTAALELDGVPCVFTGRLGLFSRESEGSWRIAVCHARELRLGGLSLKWDSPKDFVELDWNGSDLRVVSGDLD